jgi:hypothetical protein
MNEANILLPFTLYQLKVIAKVWMDYIAVAQFESFLLCRK